MIYEHCAIPDSAVPQASEATFQHALDIYAGETNKVASTWLEFSDSDLAYKPHPKSSSVAEILCHQLLSERRFFAEFLGTSEPGPALLPPLPPVQESIPGPALRVWFAAHNRISVRALCAYMRLYALASTCMRKNEKVPDAA